MWTTPLVACGASPAPPCGNVKANANAAMATSNNAITLSHLGDHHRQRGDLEVARAVWREAVTILDDLDPAEAAAVRKRLADRAEEA